MSVENITLKNGTQVTIRELRQADLPAIQQMHERTSQASLDARYLGGRAPDQAELAGMVRRVESSAAALVAVAAGPEERVVGFGYYVVTGYRPLTAEPAMLIEDAYQGMGLGSVLAQKLMAAAQASGVQVVEMYVAIDNTRVMRMVRASGFPYEQQFGYGMREVRLVLAEPQPVPHLRRVSEPVAAR